jgi:hypothetical protein
MADGFIAPWVQLAGQLVSNRGAFEEHLGIPPTVNTDIPLIQ